MLKFEMTECTSAVSSDVEGSMYEHAKQLGITLITISLRYVSSVASCSMHLHHLIFSFRPSLAKYHTHLLTIHPSTSSSHPSSPGSMSQSGTRNWTLTRVGTAEERMGIDREIALLEGKLAEVDNWQKRVKELEILLSQTET